MRLLVALLLLTGPVGAQAPEDRDKARAFFRTAQQHYDLGEFADALHDFKEAYRFFEDPTFLFNIGQCHRQMGQKEQALRFFRVYLAKSPNAPNKADVKDMMAKLELALADEHKAQSGKPQGTMEPPAPVEKPPAPVEKPPAPVEKPPAPVEKPPAPVEKPPVAKAAEKPIYKKWWLWTAVGVVVAAGVGIGLGVGLSSTGAPSATTDFGTYKPF